MQLRPAGSMQSAGHVLLRRLAARPFFGNALMCFSRQSLLHSKGFELRPVVHKAGGEFQGCIEQQFARLVRRRRGFAKTGQRLALFLSRPAP